MTNNKHNKSLDEIRDTILHTSRHGIRRLLNNLHNDGKCDDRGRSLVGIHLLEGVDDQTDELLCVVFLIRFVTLDWSGRYISANLLKFTQHKVARETCGPLPKGSDTFVERLLTRHLAYAKAPKRISETRRRRCELRNKWYLENFNTMHANSMAASAEKFQQIFAIPPGYNPLRKCQTLEKLVYCANMIRNHGSQWVWQVEPYLDDPIYYSLLRFHANPCYWHSEEGNYSIPPQRGTFNVTATQKEFTRWFNQGRARDIYEVTRWELNNIRLNPHYLELVAQVTLLERVDRHSEDEEQTVMASVDLLIPPENIPRRLTSFTRLSMAQTICSLAHGVMSVEQIEEPRLAALARSAVACRKGDISADCLKIMFADFVHTEAMRVRGCYKAAFELAGALQQNDNFEEVFFRFGGTGMVRPTTHRAKVDTPADIANRMMFFHRYCRKRNGRLIVLEFFYRGKNSESIYKKEPDPLIRLLLQFLVDGLEKKDIDNIMVAFLDLFQRQAEDRAAIAAWALYSWGGKRMSAMEIAKVLIGCLEEGRALP